MLRRQEKDSAELSPDEIIAFLGKGTQFKGVVTYQQGTVRIDGRVEGEIMTQGTLVVGETAEIHAEITAGIVVSSGKIVGNINATEKIQLMRTAELEGSIRTPVLIIEEGVQFNGQCQMEQSKIEQPEPALASVSGIESTDN